MFKQTTLMSHTAMLFIIAIYGLIMSTESGTGDERMTLSCRLFPLTCPVLVEGVAQGTPIPAMQGTDEGFHIVNESTEIIWVATAWYEQGQEFQTIGTINLPVVTQGQWRAMGWDLIKPGGAMVVHVPGLSTEAYIRIESNDHTVLTPRESPAQDFCTLDGNFESKEDTVEGWIALYPEQQTGSSGDSCAAAGGELREFHRLPMYHTFVVDY